MIKIIKAQKVGEPPDSRRVKTPILILGIAFMVFGVLSWRADLPKCENDRDVSIRHGWIKEYDYKPTFFGVGVQRVSTQYLTEDGKIDVYLCKIH